MKVNTILEKKNCIGCGTCAGICYPAEAIDMVMNERGFYIPNIDPQKCTECGFCYKVCPRGESNQYENLNKFVFGTFPNDFLLGNHVCCYIGHSTNETLRYNSSSGGMVTQLLISVLEEGIIDGVLVTTMKKNKPLEPEPFIARTKEEIISAMGSKYCPVPANLALKEIIKNEGKFAVVGLPCHIQGIRNAEKINSKLRNKIVLHFGILCSGMKSFLGTEYILEKTKINKNDVESIKFRGEGWPGSMEIIENEKVHRITLLSPLYYGGVYPFFVNPLCLLCSDFVAELSDISFGDAWNLAKDDIGSSLLICRTLTGENILKKNILDGKIKLEKVEREDVVNSTPLIRLKKELFQNGGGNSNRYKISSVVGSWFSTHPYKILRKFFCSSLYLFILIRIGVCTHILRKR